MIEPLRDSSLCLGSAVDEEGVGLWIMGRLIDGSALPRRLIGFATW